MILRIIIGTAIIVGGLYMLVNGVIFVITSGDESNRFLYGVMLLLGGITAGIAGMFLFKEGVPLSPETIQKKIFKLAAIKKGEVPEEVIRGEIGSSDTVDSELNSLINAGRVKKTVKDGRTYYIFSEFNA